LANFERFNYSIRYHDRLQVPHPLSLDGFRESATYIYYGSLGCLEESSTGVYTGYRQNIEAGDCIGGIRLELAGQENGRKAGQGIDFRLRRWLGNFVGADLWWSHSHGRRDSYACHACVPRTILPTRKLTALLVFYNAPFPFVVWIPLERRVSIRSGVSERLAFRCASIRLFWRSSASLRSLKPVLDFVALVR
jgi:hypothetical protein